MNIFIINLNKLEVPNSISKEKLYNLDAECTANQSNFGNYKGYNLSKYELLNSYVPKKIRKVHKDFYNWIWSFK